MKRILFLICAFLSACIPESSDWLQIFYNNTDAFIYIFINQREENGLIHPYYGELPITLDVDESPLLQGSAWAPGAIYYTLPYKETTINRGDCIHVYAFHADTLKKYTMGRNSNQQEILVSRNSMSRCRHSVSRWIRIYGEI